jgi:hypothetical protein
MHVQGDEHPALEHALVEGVALGQHRLVFPAGEDLAQFGATSRFQETRRLWSCKARNTLLFRALGAVVRGRRLGGRGASRSSR